MLGITREELIDRVVKAFVEFMLVSMHHDEEDGDYETPSQFQKQLRDHIKDSIDTSINNIAAVNLVENIEEHIEGLVLIETNRWGEEKGESLTFVEYLVQRADDYLREPVNYEGKTKKESGYPSWNSTQTRIAHMVNAHLHYSIKTAMEQALKAANSSITIGIEEAVKIKLAEIQKSLKVEVKTGR